MMGWVLYFSGSSFLENDDKSVTERWAKIMTTMTDISNWTSKISNGKDSSKKVEKGEKTSWKMRRDYNQLYYKLGFIFSIEVN